MKDKHAFVYSVRNELLVAFGYRTYKQYLKSDEWRQIRARVFAEYSHCICCEHSAEVVHHVRYDSATLLGLYISNLAPLCHSCHSRMEIEESGDKASLARANTMMFEMARQKDAKQKWLREFYRGRRESKPQRRVDAGARKKAFQRQRDQEEQEQLPRDYSGVFWIRARRRR